MPGNEGWIKRISRTTVSVREHGAPVGGIQGAAVPNKKLVPNYEETAHHVNRVIPLNGRPNSEPDCTLVSPESSGDEGDQERLGRKTASNSEGRGASNGHLPSASQSNHFPNLLFCFGTTADD